MGLWTLKLLKQQAHFISQTLFFSGLLPVKGEKTFLQLFGPFKLCFFSTPLPQQSQGCCGLVDPGLMRQQAHCVDQTHKLWHSDPALFWAFEVQWKCKPCHPVILTWGAFPFLLHCLVEFYCSPLYASCSFNHCFVSLHVCFVFVFVFSPRAGNLHSISWNYPSPPQLQCQG